MTKVKSIPKYSMGRLFMTPGVAADLPMREVHEALCRHAQGDWGDVGPEDWAANDQSVQDGSRMLSSYRTIGGIKFWIITEGDRSMTTVLLPEEY